MLELMLSNIYILWIFYKHTQSNLKSIEVYFYTFMHGKHNIMYARIKPHTDEFVHKHIIMLELDSFNSQA